MGWQQTRLDTMRKFSLFVAVLAFVVSCTPMQYVEVTEKVAVQETTLDYTESTARLLDAESNFLVMPLIANLEVSKNKITHVEKEAFANIKVNNSSIAKIEKHKRTALGRAAKAYGADILVNADIEVMTVDGRFVITITGYPAYYRDFRNATAKDIEIVNDANKAQRGTFTTIVETTKQQVNK